MAMALWLGLWRPLAMAGHNHQMYAAPSTKRQVSVTDALTCNKYGYRYDTRASVSHRAYSLTHNVNSLIQTAFLRTKAARLL